MAMSERMSDERLAQLEGHHSVLNRFNHVIELVDALKAEREEVERLREDYKELARLRKGEAVDNLATTMRLNRLLDRLEKLPKYSTNEVKNEYGDDPSVMWYSEYELEAAIAEAREDGDAN